MKNSEPKIPNTPPKKEGNWLTDIFAFLSVNIILSVFNHFSETSKTPTSAKASPEKSNPLPLS